MYPSFFAGLIASLLPAAMRPQIIRENIADLRAPAIVSGIIEFSCCLAALLLRYPAFFRSQQAAISTNVQLAAVEKGGETALMGFGIIILVAYLLRPVSLLLVYFLLEGMVRATVAFIHHEPVGTLPLYLLMIGQRKAKKEITERKLGPRVPDEVQVIGSDESEQELRVASCRPKDWNAMLTISYRERLYELAQSFEGAPPRRFVYLLRRAPGSKVVRGLHHYDPMEVVKVRPE